ncbi:MAG TPA: ATP-binding protein [Armatimonadota bacterium]|jgi:PAS domain S-box-containing protein
MMRNLRVQLLASHLTLVALMVVMMAGAVVNFLHLGRSIDRILQDNYKSVAAAQDMKDALERINSANAFLLAGQPERARRQYETYRTRFHAAYLIEAHNITERGEKVITADIGDRLWPDFERNTQRFLYAKPPIPVPTARAYYFGTLQPDFVHLKQRVQDVLNLNQMAILRADQRAKAEARQASRVGIAMTVGALVLALFFALRVIGSSLTPLRTLARQAEEIGAGHLDQRIELHREDEIGNLAASFNHMAESLREAHRREEERLHRAERMSDEALESLYDPVVVTDGEGRVVHLNRAAEGLFGPAARAAGRAVSQVINDPRVAKGVERAIRQERVSAEEGESAFVALSSGEAERTYRLRVTPMRDSDDTLLGAVAVLEDVTHLRQLDRLKTEFISVASHELRTPVTSLLLAVQLMEEGATGPLTPEQREVVAAQRQDLERLQRMMRDLLDLTRLEAGVEPPRFEIVPPRELIEAAVASVAPQVEGQGITLTSEIQADLPTVRADRAQLTRVLVNLLNNAVRHTPEGGRITVRAFDADDKVAFEVKDTGVGIPKEYLPRVFERFVQVPGATRGGAGLGLSIANTIVHAHGGDIRAESEPGQGSVFTFRLPAVGRPKGEG